MNLLEILALVSALAALATLAIQLWRSRHRHALRWVSLRPKSMLDVAEEVAASLVITYDGRPVENLTEFQFILHNSGHAPLDGTAIDRPVTWHAPGKIVGAWKTASDPPVELSLTVEDQQLEVRWSLFNQRCKALIKVLCENVSHPKTGRIEGQIRSVPTIEEKEFRSVSEEETIQRMKANAESRTGLSRMVGRALATKLGVRVARYFFGIYVSAFVLFSLNAVMFEMTAQWLPIVAGNVTVLAIVFLLALALRNPYAKLMRIHEAGRSGPADST